MWYVFRDNANTETHVCSNDVPNQGVNTPYENDDKPTVYAEVILPDIEPKPKPPKLIKTQNIQYAEINLSPSTVNLESSPNIQANDNAIAETPFRTTSFEAESGYADVTTCNYSNALSHSNSNEPPQNHKPQSTFPFENEYADIAGCDVSNKLKPALQSKPTPSHSKPKVLTDAPKMPIYSQPLKKSETRWSTWYCSAPGSWRYRRAVYYCDETNKVWNG